MTREVFSEREPRCFESCRRRLQSFLSMLMLGAGLLLTAENAFAQFGGQLFVPPPDQSEPGIPNDRFRRLPRDPLTQASTLKAEEAIRGGDVTTGLQTLQDILDQDSDFFLTEAGQSPHSLFAALETLIREHRDDYERLFGPSAAQALAQAQAEQNVWQLEQLVRRYGLTNAGAAGLRELARLDRDRGEPGRAARELELLASHPATGNPREVLLEAAQLLSATGQPALAAGLLSRHRDQFPDGAPVLPAADSRLGIRTLADAPIYEWRTPYGDVHQTGQVTAAPALFDDGWSSALIDDEFDFPSLLGAPDVSRHLAVENRNLWNAVEQQVRAKPGRIAMPAARPLIVNHMVITSGPGTVKAFDINTGRLEWNGVDLDETFDYLAKQSYSAGDAHDPVREEMRELFATVRGWRDLTSSSLSTDGQRVYAISNCQLVGTTSPQRMMQNTQRHSLLPQRANRLTAYDLAADGKKIWSAGLSGEESPLPEIERRDIFFLGAPLPVDGRLYVLGEERGQIQIFEIDPATGGVLWSLGLLNPDRDLVLDDVRRLAGLMPAYADGLLICPSGEGTISAVDPVQRQVVWTHVYSELVQPMRKQILILRMMRPQSLSASQSRDELLTDQRWFDSRIMVAGDKVIFTPPDDESLICLNLADGTPAWSTPLRRTQLVYAATIFGEDLVMVGRSEISCLSLADGTASSRWKSPVPIPGPSGRGVRMGDQFLQPLVTGEIAVVDLRTGRLLTRLPLESGIVPGNLLADRGRLIMQTSTGVVGFRSLQAVEQMIAERLAKNPHDPEGLALRGEWRLQQGELAGGLEDLKQAVQAVTLHPAQQILAWSMLDGLRTDFAGYRHQADLIERTLDNRQQRLQFLRTYALGLQNTGEYLPAFERYLKILQILPWPEPLQDIDSRWAATDSRWVLARMDELLSVADEATQQRMKRLLADWTRETADVSILLRTLPSMPIHWLDPATVLKRLAASEPVEPSLHDREAILQTLFALDNAELRIQAAAQLLTLALRGKDAATARQMLAELETRNVRLWTSGNLTSQELARSMRQNAETADLLHAEFIWPEQVRAADNAQSQARASITQIPHLGPPSVPLRGWTFFLDAGGANIEIFDPDGQHRARIATSYGGTRYAAETDLARYVSTHHHLALIVLLDRFLVLDFLSDPATPRVSVMREFAREEDNVFAGRGALTGIPRPGTRSMLLELRSGRMAANVGPLTDSVLCFGSDNDLLAIHPVTGAELWRRRDLPVGAEILGDEEYILIKPAEGNSVQVLRAMDGGTVKTVELPPGVLGALRREYGDWGRALPIVTNDPQQFQFTLYDPVRETSLWTMNGPAATRWNVVNGQDLVFLTPDRKLSVRNGMTGRERFATPLTLDQPVEQISLLDLPDEWILLTCTRPAETGTAYGMTMLAHDILTAPVDGPVIAMDRTGRQLWSRSVANQDVIVQGPTRWPLLLFNRIRGGMESLVLQRYTGELIRQKPGIDDGTGSVSWTTETQPPRVQLRFSQDRVTLLFGIPRENGAPRGPVTAPPQSEK